MTSYIDKINAFQQNTLSKVVLGTEPKKEETTWKESMEKVGRVLPPARLLTYSTIISCLQHPESMTSDATTNIEIVSAEDSSLVNELFSETPSYQKYEERLETVKLRLRQLLGRSKNKFDLDQYDVDALLAINDGPKSILIPAIKHLYETLKQGSSIPNHNDSFIRSTISLVKQQLKSRLQEKQQLRDAREAARSEAILGKLDSERIKTLHQTIDQNNSFNHRGLITFPELAGHKDIGAVYAQRRNITENICLLYILYTLSPQRIPASSYRRIFNIFEDYLPDEAGRYLPRPSDIESMRYSREEYFDLFLNISSYTTRDINQVIDKDSVLGKLSATLDELISIDLFDLSSSTKATEIISKLRGQISAQSQYNVGEPDGTELLMQSIYNRPRSEINTTLFKSDLEPIFFPEKASRLAKANFAIRNLNIGL